MTHCRFPISIRLASRRSAAPGSISIREVASRRVLRLFTLLALVGALLLPAAAGADEALDRALFERLEMAIAGDDLPGLRRFERRQFSGLLPETADWWREYLLSQLPPKAASLLPNQPIGLLTLEACGPLIGTYGIAERSDLGFDYGDIDRIRVTLALDSVNLGADISREVVNGLRDEEDGRALRALNTILFQLFAEGRTDTLYMVLDFSEGCGSEIPSLIAIKSAERLNTVNVIPDFYFSVCEDRYANPWDLSLCPWWDAATEQLMVSGIYHWQGRTRSGKIRTGWIQVDLEGPNWDTREIVLR